MVLSSIVDLTCKMAKRTLIVKAGDRLPQLKPNTGANQTARTDYGDEDDSGQEMVVNRTRI